MSPSVTIGVTVVVTFSGCEVFCSFVPKLLNYESEQLRMRKMLHEVLHDSSDGDTMAPDIPVHTEC